MATTTLKTSSDYLEDLKQAAEAQMRRPAPPIQQAAKKQKKTGSATATDEADEAADVERVSRYSYAAADAIMQGCSGFLGMCDFKRSNSATKEMTDILKQVLPGDKKLQLVKVGCNGLVVIVLAEAEPQQQQQQQQQLPEDQQDQATSANHSTMVQQQQQPLMPNSPEVQPTAVVHEILQRIEAGSIQRTRFCQRIAPVEATCLMAATPLTATITAVVSNYIAAHYGSSRSSSIAGGDQQQAPVQFAVLLKNRDTNAPNAKAALNAATSQQQQQQGDAAAAPVQPVSNTERLDKSKAINLAVAAVQECCKDIGGARVNLTGPQMVLMLEVLPLTRQQQACAVSAVPGSLMLTRPKLCVKPTAAAATGAGKHQQQH